jgi:hypothetical protein
MSELYLHIGTIKTGTKFLQRNVFTNIKGIRYSWKPTLSSALTYEDVYPNDKILISDERLSGWCEDILPVTWRFKTLKKLKMLYPNAKIIITLRTTKEEFNESHYAQITSARKFKGTYKKFISVWDKDWNNHEMIIQEIKSLWDDALILHYSELVKDANAYVKKICDYMGVETPKFKNERINKRK